MPATRLSLAARTAASIIAVLALLAGGLSTPAGASDSPVGLNGVVVDQNGAPVADALVTVLRSDTADGPFEAVPDGSPLLSPSTSANPTPTGAGGRFGWDVAAGWYEVQVEAPAAEPVVTNAMQVPPERSELVVSVMTETAVAPTPAGAVSGHVRVGGTVSTDGLTWISGVVVDEVQWRAESTPIGTGTSFTIPVSALDHSLTARISGHREVHGNTNGLTDQPATYSFGYMSDVSVGLVLPGALELAPVVTGKPVVAGTLGVSVNNPAGAALTYQWVRSGTAVAGATGPTLVLGPGDVGATFSVRVRATRTGYVPSDETSPATSAVVKSTALRATTAPRAAGATKVGATVSAAGVIWSLTPTAVSYQWLRSGTAIAHATASTYRLTTSDVGKRISVRLKATRVGYETATSTSPATALVPKVLPSVRSALVSSKVKHTRHAKVVVTVTATGVSSPVGTVQVSYGSRSKSVTLWRSSHGRITVTLPLLKKGSYIVKATYSPGGASKAILRAATSRPRTLAIY